MSSPTRNPGPPVSRSQVPQTATPARSMTTAPTPAFTRIPRISLQAQYAARHPTHTQQASRPIHPPPHPHSIPLGPPPASHWTSPSTGQNFYPYYHALPFGPTAPSTQTLPWQPPLVTQLSSAAPTHAITRGSAQLPQATSSSSFPSTQGPHCDVTLTVLTMLAPARSMLDNTWAVTLQRVHAEILQMRQFVTHEQEAHHRTLGEFAHLNSELQHANQERARLDAELARAVDGCDSVKTHMPKLIVDALKSGIGQLVSGSGDISATGDIDLHSPDVIAKISAVVDAALTAGLCKLLADVPPKKRSELQAGAGQVDVPEQLKVSAPSPTTTPTSAHRPPLVAREFTVSKSGENSDCIDFTGTDSPTPSNTPIRSHKRQRTDSQDPYTLKPVAWSGNATPNRN